MGGEKPLLNRWPPPWKGSPPRGRGKDAAEVKATGPVGITPAWAGKSVHPLHYSVVHGDHPRVGGEKCARTAHPSALAGSPPRGRGKGRTIKTIAAFTRITPAWAGKRAFSFSLALALQDHPRVGGEKYVDCRCEGGAIGSPPRGRGKGLPTVEKPNRQRITPAWAGKSDWCLPQLW